MRSKTKPRGASPAPTVKPEHPALAALKRSRWLYVAVSLVLLLPCFWQRHIEAGDLSSHIYNAWLAQLIAHGQLHGLYIAGQTTNVLFDLMLGGLFNLVGADWAQRIPVALSVLIFVWGAFALARAVSGRMPWQILPCIAILAYGWVFHMGFFNFYLSLGMSFWALALLWEPNARRVAAAIAILAVAYLAHGLPVVWVAGLAAYNLVARHLPGRSRLLLTAGAIAAIVAMRIVIEAKWHNMWGAHQFALTTGLDQAWVFDSKYYVVLVALLFFWIVLFLNVTRASSGREVFAGVPFQFCIMSAAAVFLIPTAIQIPGYKHGLAFIAERMSLGVGICVCALLACAAPRRFEQRGMLVVAALFFAFLFHDERALKFF